MAVPHVCMAWGTTYLVRPEQQSLGQRSLAAASSARQHRGSERCESRPLVPSRPHEEVDQEPHPHQRESQRRPRCAARPDASGSRSRLRGSRLAVPRDCKRPSRRAQSATR